MKRPRFTDSRIIAILGLSIAARLNCATSPTLEKSKSGAALLQKLSAMSSADIDGLDRLLTERTIKYALRVLDEIDSRISVIEQLDVSQTT